jgi:2,3-diketo-5-methylthio-1-phosphopentane phosphatase
MVIVAIAIEPLGLIALSTSTGPTLAYPLYSYLLQLSSLHNLISCTLIVPTVLTNIVLGHLWTTGFSNGDLKTPLFEDVIPTLEAWKAAGKTLAIFSSGSVQAQLQFFSYVQDGASTRDIKHLFSAHYDTVNAGPKLEKASYEKICRELNHDVSKVTFLTDNVKGMFASRTRLCSAFT